MSSVVEITNALTQLKLEPQETTLITHRGKDIYEVLCRTELTPSHALRRAADSYLHRIRLQRHSPGRIRRTDRPLGNSGVGIIESPGYWQIDTALIKQLPLPSERFQVYLFLNGTNILNHPLGDPSSIEITAVPTRGRIPGIRADGNASGIGVRQMQFGLRVKF